MKRRSFLTIVGASFFARKIPQQLLQVAITHTPAIVPRAWVAYSLGFIISKELLEDDYYGTSIMKEMKANEKLLAKAMADEMDRKIMERYTGDLNADS